MKTMMGVAVAMFVMFVAACGTKATTTDVINNTETTDVVDEDTTNSVEDDSTVWDDASDTFWTTDGGEQICVVPAPSQCKYDDDCSPKPCQANGKCVTVWNNKDCARLCQFQQLCEEHEVCYNNQCCEPMCTGKKCGDDGCGGSCGACTGQDACFNGKCTCQPNCTGKECGPDGCGGSCGTCTGQDSCIIDHCVCQPYCAGKECGDDGCGGLCNKCPPGYYCVNDACVCEPMCTGKECGDDGCSGNCGACTGQDACIDGWCMCQPVCDDKECGNDGCGGLCGTCPNGPCKANGTCACIPTCKDKECGDDGCGGSCGTCTLLNEGCVNHECQCVPNCNEKNCGPDICGGSCGECGESTVCYEGICVPEQEMNCADGADNDFDGSIDCNDTNCWSKDAAFFQLIVKNDPKLKYCQCSAQEDDNCANNIGFNEKWYGVYDGSPDVPEYIQKIYDTCHKQTFVWVSVDAQATVKIDNTQSPFPLDVYATDDVPWCGWCGDYILGYGICTPKFGPWDTEGPTPDYTYQVQPFSELTVPALTGDKWVVAIHWEYTPLAPP